MEGAESAIVRRDKKRYFNFGIPASNEAMSATRTRAREDGGRLGWILTVLTKSFASLDARDHLRRSCNDPPPADP